MENSNTFGFIQPRQPAVLGNNPAGNCQTITVKKVITDVNGGVGGSGGGKHQTTSTPCHDQNNQLNANNQPLIHDYFLSPTTANTSLIGNGSRLDTNLITMNGSDMNSNSTSRNVPILGTNININNISNNNANNNHNNNNSNASHDIISYQRIKKIVIDSAQSNEAQLKAKENMLNHLKSIDLSKYSFPNENKPRTDYTYAKSSSYLKECKEFANDNVEMPNLCRRARRSPQNSLLVNSSASASILNKSDTLSTTNLINKDQQIETDELEKSKGRSGIYQYIRSYLFSPNDKEKQTDTNGVNTKKESDSLSTLRTLPLVRNLHKELDDDNNLEINKNRKNLSKKTATFGITPQDAGAAGATHLSSETSSTISTETGSTFITTRSQIYQSRSSTGLAATMPNGSQNGNLNQVVINKNRSNCCGLPLLFLLILIPFLMYGLNKIDEKEHIYERINQNYIKKYLDIEISPETVEFVKNKIHNSAENVRYFFIDYLPRMFALDNIKNQTSFFTQKTTSYLNEIIDYKPSTSGSFDMVKDLFTDNEQDLVQKLNDLKEKVLSETISNIKNVKMIDVEMIRKELDQKFNYTLTMMSNKLADQLSQFELSKNNYENELKKVKDVVNELDSRYTLIINQLQEQKNFNEQLKSTQTKQSKEETDILKEKLKETFSDEHISFKKIEEYINRTFYVYNADKTGMTDFASESIGGSILFTRCTEDYKDNSKWFTVFDVPITRIVVSPRVVIQGSIQPGNCWAFKGSKADLFIKLAARITPTSFSLEHIPKELSLTGNIDSAPQNFTVYGYANKDDISDENRLLLGNYRYDNESKNTLQFFSVQHEYLDKPISVIELKIESNAGNKDFTCLYKFRVHGKLFKLNENVEKASDDLRESTENTQTNDRVTQSENINRNEI